MALPTSCWSRWEHKAAQVPLPSPGHPPPQGPWEGCHQYEDLSPALAQGVTVLQGIPVHGAVCSPESIANQSQKPSP